MFLQQGARRGASRDREAGTSCFLEQHLVPLINLCRILSPVSFSHTEVWWASFFFILKHLAKALLIYIFIGSREVINHPEPQTAEVFSLQILILYVSLLPTGRMLVVINLQNGNYDHALRKKTMYISERPPN